MRKLLAERKTMNSKEKTIWYLVMNTKDLIAINYQNKNGDWMDNQMKSYYFTLKNICYEIACRNKAKTEMRKFVETLDTDMEAIEKMIEEEIDNV